MVYWYTGKNTLRVTGCGFEMMERWNNGIMEQQGNDGILE